MVETHTILCGHCLVPVQGPDNPNNNDLISCPKCGQSARHRDVIKSAEEYVTDYMQIELNKSMESAARGSKLMTFKGQTRLTKKYSYVVDFR